MSLKAGSVLEGVVTGITKFGAFVLLPGGETGLVHISEVANTYVKDINEHLNMNDKVKVKVLNVEADGKVGLSIRQAKKGGASQNKKRFAMSFEDKLNRFLKESDEKQQDLKKNTESKRGGKSAYKQAF